MMDPRLKSGLLHAVARRRRVQLGWKLAGAWAGAALLGLGLAALRWQTGLTLPLAFPVLALLGLGAAVLLVVRNRQAQPEWREVARQIEARHPELDGRLLTAVQQQAGDGGRFNYLQERVIQEALRHSRGSDWAGAIPRFRVALAQAAQLLALLMFAVVLWELRAPGTPGARAASVESRVSVIPGDTTLERGSSLVVMARFSNPLPAAVDLVMGGSPESTRRIPLVKSLADPVFGGSVPEVSSNFVYRIEYAGQRTREFHVTVFEHPRLERADADLTFPAYTGQPPKRIPDTRRLSAVEGSRLDLALQFNKPVASARLVARDKDRTILPLLCETNRAAAALWQFSLTTTRTYDLQLADADGRTNKLPVSFVIEVLTNRVPELRLASPRGDLRPSPLEEISFEGTVWDDFGVPAYGLAYTLVGQPPTFVDLGRAVPAREKRPFRHLLRLEDLGVQPDQLVSWFLWADDVGPDGNVRRTTGDLFFAEVRPFDEIFREGQGMDGAQEQSGEQPGEQGNPTARLAELQKQIISATWRLQREHGASRAGGENRAGGRPAPAPAQPAKPSSALILPQAMGQRAADRSAEFSPVPAPTRRGQAPKYDDDAAVVRDSQAQAIEQAKAAAERQQDPRAATLWTGAINEMEEALAKLQRVIGSPASLPEALAAEQAAYQALLKLQQHEYQVARARRQNRSQPGGGRQQQVQRQLDQLELTQSEDRYENQRQAQPPPNAQRREQLQVMSRLQELARRQQDLNDRLKELQTALQEARSAQEREDVQRRLQRLQEEEQQMLADVDELRQRMDRPENQSRMEAERRQLDQTRQDVQRAAEAAGQGAASQALASGTRAQRQLQQLRDQMRQENSSQFTDDLREMRGQARELSRQEEDISKALQTLEEQQRRTLSGGAGVQQAQDRLARQKERLTNLLERATQVSQQAEEAEPLVSRQLYDLVRKFSQDDARNLQQTQEELLNQGLMTRNLYDRLKQTAETDEAKSITATAELLRQGYVPLAGETERRARAGIDDLKRGVERSAESVLGDDTEALRLAQQELDRLTDQLRREIAQAETPATNQPTARPSSTPAPGTRSNAAREAGNNGGEGGNVRRDWDRVLNEGPARQAGPILGENFVPWSDRLRDVEDMIEMPDLRNAVAAARERARLTRQQVKRYLKKPDWAVVRLQIVQPLAEVRDRIVEELARRESNTALVPIDRDPVPSRYSEMVRRYYEELGKEKTAE